MISSAAAPASDSSSFTHDARGAVRCTAAVTVMIVKPMIPKGGRILLDFADLEYLDSSGLGALVGLKVSALHQGLVKLELENLSPRIKDLLKMTNLLGMFSS